MSNKLANQVIRGLSIALGILVFCYFAGYAIRQAI